MTRYIALLRGVNVGRITIKSGPLRDVFDELGFDDVRTVLASGNVVFTVDDADAAKLKSRIERALSERFGYDAWIVLITHDDLEAAIDGFPFDAADSRRQPYVVFTSEPAVLDELLDDTGRFDADVDPLARGDGVVYWNPVKGTTVSTPFAKLLGKAKYKPTTTNRNLRTLHKLLD
ncbi:DUF1697 domain-containing protein [Agromyces bauzanensis]